jgi:hypothetical protein
VASTMASGHNQQTNVQIWPEAAWISSLWRAPIELWTIRAGIGAKVEFWYFLEFLIGNYWELSKFLKEFCLKLNLLLGFDNTNKLFRLSEHLSNLSLQKNENARLLVAEQIVRLNEERLQFIRSGNFSESFILIQSFLDSDTPSGSRVAVS